MAGKVQAAYLLAPMVMDLVDSGSRPRWCRSAIARGRSSWSGPTRRAKTIRDLRGRRIAIPNRFAVDHLFVRRHAQGARDDRPRRGAGRDGAARDAGGPVRQPGRRLRDRRALRGGRGGREVRAASRDLDDPGLDLLEALAHLRVVAGDDQLTAARASSWIVSKAASISGRLVMICDGLAGLDVVIEVRGVGREDHRPPRGVHGHDLQPGGVAAHAVHADAGQHVAVAVEDAAGGWRSSASPGRSAP